MIDTVRVGGIAQSLVADGASSVWGNVLIGLDDDLNHQASLLVLDRLTEKDGLEQVVTDSATFRRLVANNVEVSVLDEAEDAVDSMGCFMLSCDVIMTLEERALVQVGATKIERPVLMNMYHSANSKTSEQLGLMKDAIAGGVVVGATIDSYASKNSFVEAGLPEDSVRLIVNGIDTSIYRSDPHARKHTRAKLGIDADDPVVLLVARATKEKDIPLFLRSVFDYQRISRRGKIVVAGAGLDYDSQQFASMVQEQDIDMSRLIALGLYDNLPDLYNAADILTLTSESESRPLCISEAQATGLPVVATDAGDVAQMIDAYGLVVHRDPLALASAWKYALQNRDSMSFPATKREQLGQKRMVDEYRAMIAHILSD